MGLPDRGGVNRRRDPGTTPHHAPGALDVVHSHWARPRKGFDDEGRADPLDVVSELGGDDGQRMVGLCHDRRLAGLGRDPDDDGGRQVRDDEVLLEPSKARPRHLVLP